MYIFALVSELIWIFILRLPAAPGWLSRRSRCDRYRARLPQLLQQRHIYERLEGDSLRGWRRHYVDIEHQLPGCDLRRRIFRRVEARSAGDQRTPLDERSDERVRAGQDRVDQRV